MHPDQFPPRGSGIAGRHEKAPSAAWGHPWQLGSSWDWKTGEVLLGHWEGRLIGRADDRHMITVAGARAGKSSTVLIPNLKRYPGSCIVLDPKGELARATAARRTELGQRVFVLDPFGEVVEARPGMRAVPRTNVAQVHVVADPRGGRVTAFGVIDNIGKGAAGQAVQSLNLMAGRPEAEGLL